MLYSQLSARDGEIQLKANDRRRDMRPIEGKNAWMHSICQMIWQIHPRDAVQGRTVDVSESCFSFICSFGSLTRPHKHAGHREHGGNGKDFVGAPVRGSVSTLSDNLL